MSDVTLPLPLPQGAEPRPWLKARLRAPQDALYSQEVLLYGQLREHDLWLGITSPGQLRPVQRIFQGRLVTSGEGAWTLVGRMVLPPNLKVRLGIFALMTTAGLGLGAWRLASHAPDPGLPFALGVVPLLWGIAIYVLSLRAGRVDLERIRAALAPSAS